MTFLVAGYARTCNTTVVGSLCMRLIDWIFLIFCWWQDVIQYVEHMATRRRRVGYDHQNDIQCRKRTCPLRHDPPYTCHAQSIQSNTSRCSWRQRRHQSTRRHLSHNCTLPPDSCMVRIALTPTTCSKSHTIRLRQCAGEDRVLAVRGKPRSCQMQMTLISSTHP